MLLAPYQHQGRFTQRGNALAPILIIAVALICSVAVFFLFTRKKMEQKSAANSKEVATAPAATPTPAAPTPPPTAQVPAAPSPPQTFGFARPADLGEQLARSLATDLPTAAKLIAAGDPAQQAAVQATLEKIKAMGYKPAAPDQVQIIGQTGNVMRLAIPLLKADGTATDERLNVDIVRDQKMGWKVSALKLPKELATALVGIEAIPATAPSATPGAATAPKAAMSPLISVEAEPDALNFASDFVRALLKPDYDAARNFIDEKKVSTLKLAALCIVFEDGQYALQTNRPLTSTVATETTSWIIAKVLSKQSNVDTEFGLEMEKLGPEGWRVTGLNLSKILDDSSKASPEVGVPYTPLVQNPKGGESIALYFEYDSDTLHPRARRQLEIISGILKASPSSKLTISGYTDALGSDRYNLNLSNKRAAAVKQTLLDFQVPLAQVETVGFGAADPLLPNVNPDGTDNPDNRSKNRRAEIFLDF